MPVQYFVVLGLASLRVLLSLASAFAAAPPAGRGLADAAALLHIALAAGASLLRRGGWGGGGGGGGAITDGPVLSTRKLGAIDMMAGWLQRALRLQALCT